MHRVKVLGLGKVEEVAPSTAYPNLVNVLGKEVGFGVDVDSGVFVEAVVAGEMDVAGIREGVDCGVKVGEGVGGLGSANV